MKFVLVGQSPSVMAAARGIGNKDPSAEIVIISCDGKIPYDRFLLPQLISKKVKEKDLFLEADELLKSYDINIVLDKEITRINFNRRRIFLSEKQNLDYDVLILADIPQIRLPAIKGIRRTGVFHLARLDSVKGLLRQLPFIETAVIEIDSIRGVETALALKDLGKDVLAVSGQEKLLAEYLDDASAQALASLLEKRGIRSMLNNSFEDVLGESEVKAVRLKSGKVVACEAVIFGDPLPDLRFLEEGGLVIGQRVPVAGNMCTNIANVYAVDAVCQMESPKLTGNYSVPREAAERQGEVAGLSALGEALVYDRTPAEGRVLLERIFTADQLAEVGLTLEAMASGSASTAVGAFSRGGPDPAGGSGG